MDEDRIRAQVEEYLSAVKGLVLARRWHCAPRNLPDILNLGLTMADVRDCLIALTVGDYCRGPEPDRDPNRPGDVWIFLTSVQGITVEIYAKLKTDPQSTHLTVLSFHPPKHKIIRRFKP